VHQRQVGDDPFGEAQFPGGGALTPGQQSGDLPISPLTRTRQPPDVPGRAGPAPAEFNQLGLQQRLVIAELPVTGLHHGGPVGNFSTITIRSVISSITDSFQCPAPNGIHPAVTG
jgi:hypothetical protein